MEPLVIASFDASALASPAAALSPVGAAAAAPGAGRGSMPHGSEEGGEGEEGEWGFGERMSVEQIPSEGLVPVPVKRLDPTSLLKQLSRSQDKTGEKNATQFALASSQSAPPSSTADAEPPRVDAGSSTSGGAGVLDRLARDSEADAARHAEARRRKEEEISDQQQQQQRQEEREGKQKEDEREKGRDEALQQAQQAPAPDGNLPELPPAAATSAAAAAAAAAAETAETPFAIAPIAPEDDTSQSSNSMATGIRMLHRKIGPCIASLSQVKIRMATGGIDEWRNTAEVVQLVADAHASLEKMRAIVQPIVASMPEGAAKENTAPGNTEGGGRKVEQGRRELEMEIARLRVRMSKQVSMMQGSGCSELVLLGLVEIFGAWGRGYAIALLEPSLES